MKQNESLGRDRKAFMTHGLLPRRAVLSLACLSITLAACASVTKSRDSFVALESDKFT